MEQWYSDAYFPRRQIHVIRKDVRFTLKGRKSNNRNYSLSNSHVRIAFENLLAISTAITILSIDHKRTKFGFQTSSPRATIAHLRVNKYSHWTDTELSPFPMKKPMFPKLPLTLINHTPSTPLFLHLPLFRSQAAKVFKNPKFSLFPM